MSRFCEKCGNELPDNAVFCDRCGAAMPNVGAPQGLQQQYQVPQPQGQPYNQGYQPQGQPYQQVYQQQQYQAPPYPGSTQPYMQPQNSVPKKKSPAGAIIAIIIVAALAGGGYVGYTKFFSDKANEKAGNIEENEYFTVKEVSEEPEKPEEPEEPVKKDYISEESEKEDIGSENETDITEYSESTDVSTGEYDVRDGTVDENNFSWLIEYNPDAGEKITSFDDMLGKWNVMIQYYDVGDYIGSEYGFGVFEGDSENVKWAFYPMTMQYNGEPPFDESNDDPRGYEGWFKEDGLYLAGILGNVTTHYITAVDGSQYFLGTFIAPDGMESSIYMVRP